MYKNRCYKVHGIIIFAGGVRFCLLVTCHKSNTFLFYGNTFYVFRLGGVRREYRIYKRCLLVNLQFGIKYWLKIKLDYVGSDSQTKL